MYRAGLGPGENPVSSEIIRRQRRLAAAARHLAGFHQPGEQKETECPITDRFP
jgi:hypothetical protein